MEQPPDQTWIKENIDLIMRQVLKINPKRKGKEQKHRTWRSDTKSKFIDDMDTPAARPYYYLAKHTKEESRLFKIIKEKKAETKNLETCIKIQADKYDKAKQRCIDTFGKDSHQYQKIFGL